MQLRMEFWTSGSRNQQQGELAAAKLANQLPQRGDGDGCIWIYEERNLFHSSTLGSASTGIYAT
ncbi:hypothetical protein E4U54_008151 [Claviceps lovelessii]|nr:hypothetical protein E4U54_008151 [Claviceps lovelessii]